MLFYYAAWRLLCETAEYFTALWLTFNMAKKKKGKVDKNPAFFGFFFFFKCVFVFNSPPAVTKLLIKLKLK